MLGLRTFLFHVCVSFSSSSSLSFPPNEMFSDEIGDNEISLPISSLSFAIKSLSVNPQILILHRYNSTPFSRNSIVNTTMCSALSIHLIWGNPALYLEFLLSTYPNNLSLGHIRLVHIHKKNCFDESVFVSHEVFQRDMSSSRIQTSAQLASYGVFRFLCGVLSDAISRHWVY